MGEPEGRFIKGWDYTHLTKPALEVEKVFTAIPEAESSDGAMAKIKVVFNEKANRKTYRLNRHNSFRYYSQDVLQIQDYSFFTENQGDKAVKMNYDLMEKIGQPGVNVPNETWRDFMALIEAGFRLSGDYWSPAKSEESANLLNKPSLREFIPDTTQEPVKVESAYHTLMGEHNVYHYNASLGNLPIRWALGATYHGGQMKVWVHKVYFRDEEGQVNSYGLYPTNIGPAFFNNKPFDYDIQAKGRGVKVHKHYHDMTSILPQGVPFLNAFVRNITNKFREDALRHINSQNAVRQYGTTCFGTTQWRVGYRAVWFRTWFGFHSWQHTVVEAVVAESEFENTYKLNKNWLKYLFQQIAGADMADTKKKWSDLKTAFEREYTVSLAETVKELKYKLVY